MKKIDFLFVFKVFKNEKFEEILPIKEPLHPTIISYDKPVPGSTLRCLEDPNLTNEINITAVPTATVVATDDLNEARERFDRFWGSKKDENDKY